LAISISGLRNRISCASRRHTPHVSDVWHLTATQRRVSRVTWRAKKHTMESWKSKRSSCLSTRAALLSIERELCPLSKAQLPPCSKSLLQPSSIVCEPIARVPCAVASRVGSLSRPQSFHDSSAPRTISPCTGSPLASWRHRRRPPGPRCTQRPALREKRPRKPLRAAPPHGPWASLCGRRQKSADRQAGGK